MRNLLLLLPATILPGLGACGGGPSPPPEDGRIAVAVTIPPQAWLVQKVGGPRVETTVLVRPGESPATYLPTDAQISRVMQADLYFRIGVPCEQGRWFQAVQRAIPDRIVDARQGIALRPMGKACAHGEGPEGHAHGPRSGQDPHIWLSPALLKRQARTVAESLVRIDPEREMLYNKNLALLLAELDETEEEVRRILAPLRGTRIYVFHPSWGYLCADFGLTQVAIEVDGKEPSDHELTAMRERAQADGVKVIFVQPQIPGQAARAVAEAIGGEVRELDPLAEDVAANLKRTARIIAGAGR